MEEGRVDNHSRSLVENWLAAVIAGRTQSIKGGVRLEKRLGKERGKERWKVGEEGWMDSDDRRCSKKTRAIVGVEQRMEERKEEMEGGEEAAQRQCGGRQWCCWRRSPVAACQNRGGVFN